MKDKFETEIEKLIESYIDLPYNHKTLIGEITEAHQQAMKEKIKEILVLVESNLALFFNKPKDIGYYNAVKHLVKEIAKENNIKL